MSYRLINVNVMLQSLTRLLFPADCVSCQAEGDWLCETCRADLVMTRAERCRICGKGQFSGRGICASCQKTTGLDGVVSLFEYSQMAAGRLIKVGKYREQADALRFFAATYRTKLLRALPDEDWVFSFAPLSRDRFAQRGFNQAELIARLVAGDDFPVQPLFKKLAATAHQADLDGQERRANLKKAFSLVATPPFDSTQGKPAKLVICDDVITTGTTLGRLAKLAKKNGAEQVWALTLAHS